MRRRSSGDSPLPGCGGQFLFFRSSADISRLFDHSRPTGRFKVDEYPQGGVHQACPFLSDYVRFLSHPARLPVGRRHNSGLCEAGFMGFQEFPFRARFDSGNSVQGNFRRIKLCHRLFQYAGRVAPVHPIYRIPRFAQNDKPQDSDIGKALTVYSHVLTRMSGLC